MTKILLVIAAMVFMPWFLLKITKLDKLIPLPIAQMAFGICFGPSAVGSYWPDFWLAIFTEPIKQGLDAVQLLAIVIFSFIAGLELKPKELVDKEGSSLWIQAFQVVFVPILLAGTCMMLFFNDPIWHNPKIPFWKFAWSMGVATCITALPMLVISCKELGIWGTDLSRKLLGLVIFDDLILWLTVALIISLGGHLTNVVIFFSVVGLLFYCWPKILNKVEEMAWPTLTVTLVLSMAYFSHWAGLHYVLGAFIAGMLTPREVVKWNHGMEYQQMYWLMPVFFIWTGLKAKWTLNFETIIVGALGMFIIAIFTKFVGVWLAYRKQGMRVVFFKTAILQTKGLMEILLVTMLLAVDIVSVNMYAAVIIMSLVSTVIAVPVARLFYKPELDKID